VDDQQVCWKAFGRDLTGICSLFTAQQRPPERSQLNGTGPNCDRQSWRRAFRAGQPFDSARDRGSGHIYGGTYAVMMTSPQISAKIAARLLQPERRRVDLPADIVRWTSCTSMTGELRMWLAQPRAGSAEGTAAADGGTTGCDCAASNRSREAMRPDGHHRSWRQFRRNRSCCHDRICIRQRRQYRRRVPFTRRGFGLVRRGIIALR